MTHARALAVAVIVVLITSVRAEADDAAPAPRPGDLVGTWKGTLDIGPIQSILVLRVTATAEVEGRLDATLDVLDQGVRGIPLDSVHLESSRLHFELKSAAAVYDGEVDAPPTRIVGEWKQAGEAYRLVLERTTEEPTLRRPQTPPKPYPYREVEVTFHSPADDVKLAGTLTLPPTEGRHPALVLISGSGAQDRDETMMGHKPFLVLADHLTRRGVAVLRTDDRGVGGSTGETYRATLEDGARDALAALAFLKARPDIDPRRIGLLGHSEGGWVAPIAATISADVAFVVLLGGPALPGDQVLQLQGRLILQNMGVLGDALERELALSRRFHEVLKSRVPDDIARRELERILEEYLHVVPESSRQPLRGRMEGQIALSLSPWFRSFISHDPRPVLEHLRCPLLAVSGAKDMHVPPAQNHPALVAALESSGHPDYAIVKLAGLNHLLQSCDSGAPAEYARIEETIAPAALDAIAGWIERHVQ